MNNRHLNFSDSSVLDFNFLIFERKEIISGGLVNMIHKIGFHGRIDVVTNEMNVQVIMDKYNSELIIIGIHNHDSEEMMAVERIIKAYPKAYIILSGYFADKSQQEKFKAMGVKGFINHGILLTVLEQVLLTVRSGETYFEFLNGNLNKGIASEHVIIDVELDAIDFIIIRGRLIGLTSEDISNLREVTIGIDAIKARTLKWRDAYHVTTTMQAIKIMKDRGLLDGMDE
jgi:AmiR/NasT family two-component response regulator